MSVDEGDIGRPVEMQRAVEGEKIGVLHRQICRGRDVGERRHDRGDQDDLRGAAEDEHHLRIAPQRRPGIGVRKAAVNSDIADGNREPGQFDGEVREYQAQREHRATAPMTIELIRK